MPRPLSCTSLCCRHSIVSAAGLFIALPLWQHPSRRDGHQLVGLREEAPAGPGTCRLCLPAAEREAFSKRARAEAKNKETYIIVNKKQSETLGSSVAGRLQGESTAFLSSSFLPAFGSEGAGVPLQTAEQPRKRGAVRTNLGVAAMELCKRGA